MNNTLSIVIWLFFVCLFVLIIQLFFRIPNREDDSPTALLSRSLDLSKGTFRGKSSTSNEDEGINIYSVASNSQDNLIKSMLSKIDLMET